MLVGFDGALSTSIHHLRLMSEHNRWEERREIGTVYILILAYYLHLILSLEELGDREGVSGNMPYRTDNSWRKVCLGVTGVDYCTGLGFKG